MRAKNAAFALVVAVSMLWARTKQAPPWSDET